MRRVFLGGQMMSLLGDGLAVLAVPLLVLELTRDPLTAALASATRSVGYLFVGLPAGPIVDRVDPWRVLIVADLVRGAAFGLLALLAVLAVRATGPGPAPAALLSVIFTVALAAACATVFFDAALAIAVRDTFPRGRVVGANASLETAAQLSRVIGPGTVGVLATVGGISIALLINATTFLVSLASLLIVAPTGLATRAARRSPAATSSPAEPAAARPRPAPRALLADLAEGLRHLRRQRLVRDLMLLAAAVNVCLAVDTLIVYFARVALALDPGRVSVAVAAGGAGGVLGALATPWLAAVFRRVPLIAAALLGSAAAVAAMAAAPSWQMFAAANAALAFVITHASVLNRSLRQELVPREMLGRVTVAARTLMLSATPVGMLLVGVAVRAAHGDPRPVFFAAAAALTVIVTAGWFAWLRPHAGLVIGRAGSRPA